MKIKATQIHLLKVIFVLNFSYGQNSDSRSCSSNLAVCFVLNDVPYRLNHLPNSVLVIKVSVT